MNHLNKNGEGKYSTVFHIALDGNGKLQPIICVQLPVGDMALLCGLLNTNRPGASSKENGDGTGYLFFYDNNMKKPYPSVMIWKFRIEGDRRIMCDMEQKDLAVIPYAVETYLAE